MIGCPRAKGDTTEMLIEPVLERILAGVQIDWDSAWTERLEQDLQYQQIWAVAKASTE